MRYGHDVNSVLLRGSLMSLTEIVHFSPGAIKNRNEVSTQTANEFLNTFFYEGGLVPFSSSESEFAPTVH